MTRRTKAAALGLTLVLAAPVTAGPTGPLSVPPAAQAVLDKELAATWEKVRPELDAALVAAVAKLKGTTHGDLTIDRLDIAQKNLAAAPRISVTPLETGKKKFLFFSWGTARYDGERVKLELPREGTSWSIKLAGHVTYKIDKKVLFFNVKKTISEDVTIEVKNLRARDEVELDTSDVTRPVAKKVGDAKLDYDLKVDTSSTLLDVVLFITKPIVDKILRDQVEKALEKLDQMAAPLVGLPKKDPWGVNAPARAAFGQQPDLERFALQVSDDVQKSHVPFGTILSTRFTDPTYGQGQVDHFFDFGDSAIWTGHYVAGESFRYAVTRDPRAQANAMRSLEGIRDLFDAEKPGDGHLARCVVPLSHPDAQRILQSSSSFTTTIRGQPYASLEHISRDQYLGVMHGLGVAYDLLDDPAAKKLAGELIVRAVDYLVRNKWVALRHDGVRPSAPFVQSPHKMIAFAALAARVDARFKPLHDELGQLAHVEWVFGWTGLLDPLTSYYKWNLGYGGTYHAMRLETNPERHAALDRAHEMTRRAIGHHENAYFQTIDAAVNPALTAQLAAPVLDELRRFAARPRRYRAIDYRNDPTVAKDFYEVPLSYQKTGPGGGTGGTLLPRRELRAKFTIAVEKRISTDYLWQRDPFQLDAGGDPHEQGPGVDMVLPYWMARFYRLVP